METLFSTGGWIVTLSILSIALLGLAIYWTYQYSRLLEKHNIRLYEYEECIRRLKALNIEYTELGDDYTNLKEKYRLFMDGAFEEDKMKNIILLDQGQRIDALTDNMAVLQCKLEITQDSHSELTEKYTDLHKKYISSVNSINSALSRVPDSLKTEGKTLSFYVNQMAKFWDYETSNLDELLKGVESEYVVVAFNKLRPVFTWECSENEFVAYLENERKLTKAFGEFDITAAYKNVDGNLIGVS